MLNNINIIYIIKSGTTQNDTNSYTRAVAHSLEIKKVAYIYLLSILAGAHLVHTIIYSGSREAAVDLRNKYWHVKYFLITKYLTGVHGSG